MLIEVTKLEAGWDDSKIKSKTLIINTNQIVCMEPITFFDKPAFDLRLEKTGFVITAESAKKILAIANKPL